MSFLRKVVEEVRVEVKKRKEEGGVDGLSPPRKKLSLKKAIRRTGRVPLIAELKRSSPSSGKIRSFSDPLWIGREMVEGGAIALSVLTESKYFEGDPLFLRELSVLPVPLLCKDFVVDPYQVEEASRLGADAILLIVRVLGKELPSFLSLAREEGMEALVEVTNEKELEEALSAGADLIGINNRDLDTLEVDLSRTERLAPLIPSNITVVSESGIGTPEEVRRMLRAGAHAVLVGTSLMRAENIREKVRELVEAMG
ncbi:MAG: indole-3-glycerol-phosphate synthase [Candidatus Hadarchaeales archaeon]